MPKRPNLKHVEETQADFTTPTSRLTTQRLSFFSPRWRQRPTPFVLQMSDIHEPPQITQDVTNVVLFVLWWSLSIMPCNSQRRCQPRWPFPTAGRVTTERRGGILHISRLYSDDPTVVIPQIPMIRFSLYSHKSRRIEAPCFTASVTISMPHAFDHIYLLLSDGE